MSHSITDQPATSQARGVGRILALFYGVCCYLVFFATFLYAIGFVANFGVPKSIDRGTSTSFGVALIVNLLLLGLFSIQHSGMARPEFKQWWTRIVPRPLERSTYILLASLALLVLFWQWRPLPTLVWQIDTPIGKLALHGLSGLGWLIVLLSTFLINHFDLFGLRQVYLYQRRRPYTELGFQTPFLYKIIRHPIMLGFLIAFWATPRMTLGHLLFAAATSAYILAALHLEERDLVRFFGDTYCEYRKRTPMLFPRPSKK